MTRHLSRPAALTGTQLQRTVMEMAAAFGLHTAHFRAAQARDGRWLTPVAGDGKGWPDLFITGAAGFMWREIKRVDEKLTPEQEAWIVWIRGAGGDVDVWRPGDLRSGRIERELRALRTPRPEGHRL